MKYFKEILNKIKHKNDTTFVGASIARPPSKARPHTKTIAITLPILILLIAVLIAIGITNAANNATEPQTDQTFTEEGDGYYIWVRAVDHAGNKGPWSEAQRVWIDNKGPSAPTITGGSSEYALSRTISVSIASDDNGASGVAYYEYHTKSGSDKPDANVAGTKVTTTATSQEFNTNMAGDYVFFRAVDVVGNKGAWSDGQQVYIDVNAPVVSAKNTSVTITEGDSYEMSSYFTVEANGTNTNITTTYTVNENSYTNTSSLSVGTHILICTANKVGGNSDSESVTIVVKRNIPDYTEKSWTTAGTYTWTVPEGVTKVRVAVCGGGGGSAMNYGSYNGYKAVAGGSSSFGNLVTATGGNGGQALSSYDGETGGAYGYGGNGGSPNGNAGTAGYGDSSGGKRVCVLICFRIW